MSLSNIRKTLESIEAIDSERVEILATKTRDQEILVFRDPITEVIFIDDWYVGDLEYQQGLYRGASASPNYEDFADTERRVKDFRPLYHGKSILDFGCGSGNFLRRVRSSVVDPYGIELQEDFRNCLNEEGILCFENLDMVPTELDVVCMFHVLEHLPDPLTTLAEIKSKFSKNGTLIVEVPHARDFLISSLNFQPFLQFTLWSQHLVLHTRESLTRLLRQAGFKNVTIHGVQRYGIANHMHWLNEGEPGGHRGSLSVLETNELTAAYAAALAKADRTDTLVAIAQ